MTVTRLETARVTLRLAEDAFKRARRRLVDAQELLKEEEQRSKRQGDIPSALEALFTVDISPLRVYIWPPIQRRPQWS